MVCARTCLLIAALLACAGFGQPLLAQTTAQRDIPGVRAAEEALRAAVAARDRAAVDRLVASDFRAGEPRDRAAWIERQLSRCGGGPASIADIDVVLDGDVALVAFDAMVELDVTCAPAAKVVRRADVWTWREGRWQLRLRTERGEASLQPPPAVGTAAVPQPPPETAPLAASTEVTLLSTRGNVNTLTFGANGSFGWERGRSHTTAKVAFLRTTASGQERGRSIDLQLRESRSVSEIVELFGRGQYQRDLFAGILQRYAIDAGVGVLLVHDGQRMQATFGAGSIHEVRLKAASQSGPLATAGVQYRLTIAPDTAVSLDAQASSFLNEGANWRVESTPAVTTVLRTPLSLRVSYATKYINLPVPGFKRFDAILSLGLLARF
jgi:putative salt-induced outer membrane protein YdiY